MIYTHVAVGIIAVAVGATGAWKVQAWRWEAAEGRVANNALAQARLQRQGADAAAQAYEVVRERVRTEFVPVREEVERVVIQYRDRECLAADGLRLINEAIRAANNPREPGHPVPATVGTP